ncbi:DUF4197 domain-containing protein [Pseudothauera rhizosphaerae]|uniref:DUF4197 domain-containing protein n=1 Tax=Pseudothauera rhizosphaerae TaxID=2565932 RepID=A0A4S4AQT7_9RHOO|nr:DUF4197 domain-containing protein [Pseudothauera rhizosphaerae]THF62132.1 DUF4197 domain-containing protein [Pseudothauera rhizosphaerae]
MGPILRAFALLVICTPLWAAGGLASLAGFSEQNSATGLREALTQGAGRAVDLLGRRDGFLANPKVKIPLPEALEKAEPLLRMTGRGKDLDELVTAMNRAAEAAVPEARSLLVNAVKQMSVQDAKNILTGGDDSGTRYFRQHTEGRLTELFLPVVKRSTDRLALAGQYNALAGQAATFGLLKAEDAQIEGYVTRKALDGLYLLIAEEERAIRANPVEAAGTWAKRIFGALK